MYFTRRNPFTLKRFKVKKYTCFEKIRFQLQEVILLICCLEMNESDQNKFL